MVSIGPAGPLRCRVQSGHVSPVRARVLSSAWHVLEDQFFMPTAMTVMDLLGSSRYILSMFSGCLSGQGTLKLDGAMRHACAATLMRLSKAMVESFKILFS